MKRRAYFTDASLGSLHKEGFKVVSNHKETGMGPGGSRITWIEVILQKGNIACYILSHRIIAEEAVSNFFYERDTKVHRYTLNDILSMEVA